MIEPRHPPRWAISPVRLALEAMLIVVLAQAMLLLALPLVLAGLPDAARVPLGLVALGLLAGPAIYWRMLAARKRAAQAEEETPSDLVLVARYTSNSVIIAGADHRITWVNEGFTRISGYSQEEALGRTADELLGNPKADPAALAELRRAMAEGRPCRVELQNRAKDGHGYWVDVHLQPIRDAQGALRGFLEVDSDISERKRTEADLLTRAAQLRLVVESMPAIVVHYDRELICRYANRRYAQALGLEPDAVVGRPMAQLLGPQLMAQGQDLIDRALAGETVRYEREQHRDASRTLDVTLVPYLRPDGVQDGYFGFGFDITEIKQTEQQLRASEQRLRQVFEVAPFPLTIRDSAGRFLLVNQAAADQLYEMRPQDMMGKTMVECGLPVAYADVISRAEQQARQTGKMLETAATSFVDQRGRRRWAVTRRVPFHFSDEHAQAILTAGIEITDLKTAEEQLRRSLSLLEATLESTTDGIIASGSDRRILLYNRRALDIWGFSEDAIANGDGRYLLQVTSQLQTDPQAFAARVEAIWAQPASESFDQLTQNDGRVIERYSRPLMQDGAPAGRVWSVRDVTARSRAEAERLGLEDQLREAQKMQAMGTLAGGIAHDFNNIIAAILGNVVLACEDIDAGRGARALQSVREIERASIRARNLVQQILAFSRRQPSERKRIALAPVVQEVGRLLRATLPARLSLSIDCDPQAPMVLADATQIEQVLLNLATNAMQALGGAAGHIQLRLDALLPDAALVIAQAQPALADLLARRAGPLARLQVIDDGPGMEPATMQRVFEPFFTTKPMGEGTGLGLSVVRGIVQTHEGEIVLESAPGQGASFSIYLPGAPEPVHGPGPFEAQAPQVGAGTGAAALASPRQLLYLDDDEAMVFMVKRLLERRGLSVSAHSSQQEALQALRADPAAFDLVVSDYNMPGLSGLDVARLVREIRPGLPVVLTSGFIDETLPAQAKEAGVVEVIFKATEVDAFCTAISNLLAKREA